MPLNKETKPNQTSCLWLYNLAGILSYLGKCKFLFWNLVFRFKILYSQENSLRYSPFLFSKMRKQNLFSSLSIRAFVSPLMIRTLCLGKHQTREDSFSQGAIMRVSSLALVKLYPKMIVVQGLPLNVVHFILNWIFSKVILKHKDWKAFQHAQWWHWQFFHADADTNIHSLQRS